MAGHLFWWGAGPWWKRSVRKWGWLGAGYLLLAAVLVTVLLWPSSPRVVSALAPASLLPGESPGLGGMLLTVLSGGRAGLFSLWESPEAPLWKWLLRQVLPALPGDHVPHDEPGWGEVLLEGMGVLTGLRWYDPLSWLVLPAPASARAQEAPVPYLAETGGPSQGAAGPSSGEPSPRPGGISGPDVPAALRGRVLVGLYCTHARESYLPALAGARDPEDAHTLDGSRNMLRVAEELARTLSQEHGIGVVMSRRVHDRQGKLGAYVRSQETVQTLLREYPDVRFLFDVHRDSPGREATVATVGGRPAARIMIVLGSPYQVGPNWAHNRALADRVSGLMEQRYPGLLRKVLVADARYNQHLSPGGLLFEIGGVENTLEEALYSAHLLADVLATVIAEEGSAPSAR
ncbi:MAG: stage II sporulation protein P [Bacillota bacterium]|nr:stage II sporulation protein P [Bacillota bacterium]